MFKSYEFELLNINFNFDSKTGIISESEGKEYHVSEASPLIVRYLAKTKPQFFDSLGLGGI